MSSEVRAEPVTEDALHEVLLVGYPLRLGVRASEHYEAVFREFALLAASEQSGAGSVPDRMVALIDALGRRYARSSDQEQQREDAIARGETSMRPGPAGARVGGRGEPHAGPRCSTRPTSSAATARC